MLPFSVMVNGTLLTGTLPGVNVVIEGGEDMNTLSGSPWDDPGVPHPIRSRLARSKTEVPHNYLLRARRRPSGGPKNDIRLSLYEARVKMKEFALSQDFALCFCVRPVCGLSLSRLQSEVPILSSLFRIT